MTDDQTSDGQSDDPQGTDAAGPDDAGGSQSPGEPTLIQYPPLTEDLEKGVSWRSLKYFGAGAIMASVTIGSGETLFASSGGAKFGYALLWCFVGGAIMKGIQVYGAARHMTLTGEHPMAHWKFLPGPRGWAPLAMGLLSLACFPFWLAGLPLMIGQTINWIFGFDIAFLGMSAGEAEAALGVLEKTDVSAYNALLQKKESLLLLTRLWATVAIVFAVTMTWFQSYGLLERIQMFIVGLLLVSMAAACIAARPDLLAGLQGLLPTVPEYPQWLRTEYPNEVKDAEWVFVGVVLGAIGGGTYDYIGYVGCFREKKWGLIGQHKTGTDQHETEAIAKSAATLPIDTSPENIRRAHRWLLPTKIDVGVGFLCVLFFTICFVLLGAVILHPKHEVPSQFELLSKQSRFLTDMYDTKWLLFLYQMGIFMAFWGTIYGAYEIYLRTAYECVMPLSKIFRRMPMPRFRAIILVYCAGGGLALVWFGSDNAMDIVKPAAIVGGVLTCGLWCFAMLWTDWRFLPKPLRMGKVLQILTWISGIVLTGLGCQAIYFAWIKPLIAWITKFV